MSEQPPLSEPAIPKRKFWQFHSFAIVIALFGLFAMLWENYRPARVVSVQPRSQEKGKEDFDVDFRFSGWPIAEVGTKRIQTDSSRLARNIASDDVSAFARQRGPNEMRPENICIVVVMDIFILVLAEFLLRQLPKKHSTPAQFHLATALLALLVIGALLGRNMVWFETETRYRYEWHSTSEDEIIEDSPHSVRSQTLGWPATISVRATDPKERLEVDPPVLHSSKSLALAVCVNISLALAMIGAATCISEWLIRRRKGRKP